MGINFQLEQLRARTDRDLAALIDHELERGLDLARTSGGRWAGAEEAVADAYKLLPKVDNLDERLRLERKWQELRAALDALADQPRIRAAAG
jgi:hypothetical protein